MQPMPMRFLSSHMSFGQGWWPEAHEHQQHRGKPPRPWAYAFPGKRWRLSISCGGTWSSESIISASDQRLKLGPWQTDFSDRVCSRKAPRRRIEPLEGTLASRAVQRTSSERGSEGGLALSRCVRLLIVC